MATLYPGWDAPTVHPLGHAPSHEYSQRAIPCKEYQQDEVHILCVFVQILELCRGGELFDRIIEQGTFTERKAAGAVLCYVIFS